MPVAARDHDYVRFGPFTVDFASRELWNDKGRVSLQDKPFQILIVLLQQPGELVSREELQRQLWADTIVDFEHSINTAVKKLREALQDDPERPRYIETLPKRGYRFIGQIEGSREERDAWTFPNDTPAPGKWHFLLRRPWYVSVGVVVVAALGLLAGLSLSGHWLRQGEISEQDTIVLTDFANKTGDPVFEDALRHALEVDLRQSPFLNILSDRKLRDTLRLMGRPADEHITITVGREACLRTGGKAVLGGSIRGLGSHYLIELDAVACATGDTLAAEESEANAKEDVLRALSQACSALRARLGESLPSVKRFEVPYEATTTSLDALKQYTLALKVKDEKGDAQSLPFLKRAVELDPNFPMAYAGLATAYGPLNQPSLALQFATKAYELRDRVSEYEKLRISATYFGCTGELEKEIETYRLWITSYPRSFSAHTNLGNHYSALGQYDKAAAEYQESMRLAPENVVNYADLAAANIFQNRLDGAKNVLDQARTRNLDGGILRYWMYSLAFLSGDRAQMEQQLAWGVGKPGEEDSLLSLQSDTEAYYGRLQKARSFSVRAVDSASGAGAHETAGFWQGVAAVREAELGNEVLAKRGVKAALATSQGQGVKVVAALALARIGDASSAETLVKELENTYPTHTLLSHFWLPTIHAAVELRQHNPTKALAYLNAAAPYEMTNSGNLYPAYVRGEAYLLAHDGTAAIAEFQKLLDHRGIVGNFVIGALAHLQMGRAYAMKGDRDKALAAYENFFTLWKDSDLDVPILRQARMEYRKFLQKV
jgi:eukaryotic-like serine/threonine-protein kinase